MPAALPRAAAASSAVAFSSFRLIFGFADRTGSAAAVRTSASTHSTRMAISELPFPPIARGSYGHLRPASSQFLRLPAAPAQLDPPGAQYVDPVERVPEFL